MMKSSLAFILVTGCVTGGEGGEDEDTSAPVDGLPGQGSDDDPQASAPYGPENSWWHADEADVPAELEGTGYKEGDIAYNFQLTDQFGDDMELYQFYGQVIVLDVFAEW